MKKSKLLVLGLIALMLAGGLVLASCGSNCPGDGKCEYSVEGVIKGWCDNAKNGSFTGCFGSGFTIGTKCKC